MCNAATEAWRLWQVIQLDTDVGTDISVAGNIDRAVDTPNLATIGVTFTDLLEARYAHACVLAHTHPRMHSGHRRAHPSAQRHARTHRRPPPSPVTHTHRAHVCTHARIHPRAHTRNRWWALWCVSSSKALLRKRLTYSPASARSRRRSSHTSSPPTASRQRRAFVCLSRLGPLPSPGADVGGGRAQSRCRCGRGELGAWEGRWEQRAQCRRRFVFSIDVILPPQVDNPTRESSESGARQMMAAVQQAKRSGAKWHVVIAYEVYVLRSVLLAMHTAGLYGEGRSLARLRARVRLRADLCVCGRGGLCTDVFVC